MNSPIEYLLYFNVRVLVFVVRHLPLRMALGLGRAIGSLAYYLDLKHKSQVCANLKIAFARTKSPEEIRAITKAFFQNFGQNLIELFLMPSLKPEEMTKLVAIEGREHLEEALQAKKGAIILAMHFGSWELASRACAMLGHPYKVIVNPQKRFFRLDGLLNFYRELGGAVVLSRKTGTRELVKGLLHNNEVIAMVVDQGGREGVLVPFFERQASLSAGAIRLALKWGVPLCFSVIVREGPASHRVILHKSLELENTGQTEKDVVVNLTKFARFMEHYIKQYPAEYMWFYKIWKYSKESVIAILNDGKKGHLNQSLALARTLETALSERGVQSQTQILDVEFRKTFWARWIPPLNSLLPSFLVQGRWALLRQALTPESFQRLMSVKADFVVSCGSSVASLNHLLSRDHQAKSLCVLKPGFLSFKRFNLVVLPRHDQPHFSRIRQGIVATRGAPNMIALEYLEHHSELLLKRFSHLKSRLALKIGLFIGGDNKNYSVTESLVKVVVDQIKEVAEELDCDILVTTSRRTGGRVESLLNRELKKYPRCPLLIIANRLEVPEAAGGILGLSDILVVSGDSVSMISEAASSGKDTIVFTIKKRKKIIPLKLAPLKHDVFIEKLNDEGYIVACDPSKVGRLIYDVAKQKIKTKTLDDRPILLDAVREIL